MTTLALPPALRQFWQQRNPRERLILLVGGIAGSSMLLWMLLITPVARERDRLNRSLPTLRNDVAEFKRDLARLQPTKNTAGQTNPLQPELNAIAGALAISPEILRIRGTPQGHVIVGAQGISWPVWLKLLEQASGRGARAEKLSIQAATGGLVNAEVELSR